MNEKPAQCPFLKQECIRDRCALWGAVDMVAPGPLGGPGKKSQVHGCVFNLLAVLIASPRPVMVVNPRVGPFPPS